MDKLRGIEKDLINKEKAYKRCDKPKRKELHLLKWRINLLLCWRHFQKKL